MPRLRTTPRKLQNQPFRPPAPPAVTSGKKRPRRRQRLALRSDTSDYSRNSNPGCEFCPLLAAFNLPGDTRESATIRRMVEDGCPRFSPRILSITSGEWVVAFYKVGDEYCLDQQPASI